MEKNNSKYKLHSLIKSAIDLHNKKLITDEEWLKISEIHGNATIKNMKITYKINK